MRRLRAGAVIAVLAATLVACSGGGARTVTVLSDAGLREFAASYFGFFPRVVEVRPGDAVVFKQVWTGEPHTITFGTAVKPLADAVAASIKGTGKIEAAEQAALTAAASSVPSIFDANRTPNQTLATSCYITKGAMPDNGAVCPKRRQPDFTGTETLFNSGFIPYSGTNGNRFGMKLASTIKTGDYFFYCALHGPTMGGFLRVIGKDAKVASQSAVDAKARREIAAVTARLRTAHTRIRDDAGEAADVIGGGFTTHTPGALELPFATVNEFEPATFQATVGQKVTWFVPRGPGHTISFGAPKNLPSVRIDPGGYQLNPKAYEPQGGPGYPKDHRSRDTVALDAGSYDGTGFLSSGISYGAMRYSLTFSKPGTYEYACLLHPGMTGTVVVT
jgi:plastocyanin